MYFTLEGGGGSFYLPPPYSYIIELQGIKYVTASMGLDKHHHFLMQRLTSRFLLLFLNKSDEHLNFLLGGKSLNEENSSSVIVCVARSVHCILYLKMIYFFCTIIPCLFQSSLPPPFSLSFLFSLPLPFSLSLPFSLFLSFSMILPFSLHVPFSLPLLSFLLLLSLLPVPFLLPASSLIPAGLPFPLSLPLSQ